MVIVTEDVAEVIPSEAVRVLVYTPGVVGPLRWMGQVCPGDRGESQGSDAERLLPEVVTPIPLAVVASPVFASVTLGYGRVSPELAPQPTR
jgi:hypothetical protein